MLTLCDYNSDCEESNQVILDIYVYDACRRAQMESYEIPEYMIDYPDLIENAEQLWNIADNFMDDISLGTMETTFYA